MSIARRLIDLAKSNLNLLLEKAAATTDPRRKLAEIPDEDLEAEVARRRAAREVENKVREARAHVDGTRADREKEARERADRVRAQRAQRAESQKEKARASAGAGAGPRPGAGRPGGGAPPPRAKNVDLARFYERLEIPYGSEFDTVKSSYRRLMRKYHPDLHSGSPEKLKAATEVSMALTEAYNELEKALKGGSSAKSR